MTEIAVPQKSQEWHEIRASLTLTASRFGDALGVGQGKPYDFLESLIFDEDGETVTSSYMDHGNRLEPIIDEAYQLLTGNVTTISGIWIPDRSSVLHSFVGASPDAKVFSSSDLNKMVGLAEYKAPVHQMYTPNSYSPAGIPRKYMAQIHGQMAVCNAPWCDFMVVCENTKEIMLKRVHFHPVYWSAISQSLLNFCHIVKEANDRKGQHLAPLLTHRAGMLRDMRMPVKMFAGEQSIRIENLLSKDNIGRFKSSRGAWLSYDFLMGIG